MRHVEKSRREQLDAIDRPVRLTSSVLPVRGPLYIGHLSRNWGKLTPDAIQMAAALVYGCEAFRTNDRDLRRVDELRVLLLDDLKP